MHTKHIQQHSFFSSSSLVGFYQSGLQMNFGHLNLRCAKQILWHREKERHREYHSHLHLSVNRGCECTFVLYNKETTCHAIATFSRSSFAHSFLFAFVNFNHFFLLLLLLYSVAAQCYSNYLNLIGNKMCIWKINNKR